MYCMTFNGNPVQSYNMLSATQDQTVLPATQHSL